METKIIAKHDTFFNNEFLKAGKVYTLENDKTVEKLIKTGVFNVDGEIAIPNTDGYTMEQFDVQLDNKEKAVSKKLQKRA